MSLDVELISHEKKACPHCGGAILVGEGGQALDPAVIYSDNITHNLRGMAREAGIYEALWRPDEHGYVYARDIVALLDAGIALMRSDPERFRKLNSPNGWGKYEHFVPFVENYATACRANPDATIRVWR